MLIGCKSWNGQGYGKKCVGRRYERKICKYDPEKKRQIFPTISTRISQRSRSHTRCCYYFFAMETGQSGMKHFLTALTVGRGGNLTKTNEKINKYKWKKNRDKTVAGAGAQRAPRHPPSLRPLFSWRGTGSVFDQHSGNFIRTEMGG